VPGFDGVRGVAVLLTVAYHFRHLLDPWTTHYVRRAKVTHLVGGGIKFSNIRWVLVLRPHPTRFFGPLIPSGGFLGVDFFFVLSGFLITALLLREQSTAGRISFPAFYRRRALRLLPALFLFVAAQVIYAVITHVKFAAERDAVVALLFYFWNWRLFFTYPAVPKGIAHLWSLSVEEQFYLVWPLAVALFFGVQRRASSVIAGMVACIAAVALWRFVLTGDGHLILLYFRTDVRADELIVGALAAYLWTRGLVPPKRVLVPLAWISLVFVTVCVFRLDSNDRFLFKGGFTAIAIAVALMLLAIIETGWLSRVLERRTLRSIGRVSYGLYLWHFLVFAVVAEKMPTAGTPLRLTTAFTVSIFVTLFSWFVVERRFLRRKTPVSSETSPVPRQSSS
jgi:peptidoglycan/LPS O-acetylase OafA/YrhL